MTAALDDLLLTLHLGGGVLCRRDHPRLAGAIDHAVQHGRLRALLPGVYVDAGRPPDPELLVRVLTAWDPDALLTGHAAARLTFWPDLPVPVVQAAARRTRAETPGFALSRRLVDPDLVLETGGLRLTTPALRALDLAPSLGGAVIDELLRSRRATLANMHRVLDRQGHRPGDRERRWLLEDSHDEPWSEAERLAHRLLREDGNSGWRTNLPIEVSGFRYYLDIAFPDLNLAIESTAGGSTVRGSSSRTGRGNDLTLVGWRVLHVTWLMLTQTPAAVLIAIRAALQGL